MAVTQTISVIPPAGHRGIDSRDTFVAKQEAFQDALVGTTVTELNNVISQINSTETNINNKEASVVSSANTATIQAGVATTKASEASASATSAYNAQLAAEATLDNFDDRYLGAKTTPPTLDNDGNPLQSGAMYWNTTNNTMYVRDTTLNQWISLAFVPTDHGGLTGLSDDDHPQYHNDARGDARYLKLSGGTVTGLKETSVAMPAKDIDLNLGNLFTKTITGATALTVSNVPASGTVGYFILKLTNGGAGAVTFPAGTKWSKGLAPTLTASGVDLFRFLTIDGGTRWDASRIQEDSK